MITDFKVKMTTDLAKGIAFGTLSYNRSIFGLNFDKLELSAHESLEEAGIVAEIILHELNEAEIVLAMLKMTPALNVKQDSNIQAIGHNLNTISLNEAPLFDISTIFTYQKSARLANIDGKDHSGKLLKLRIMREIALSREKLRKGI